jgi:hypothetical protein
MRSAPVEAPISFRRLGQILARLTEGQFPPGPGPGLTPVTATEWYRRNRYPLLAVADVGPSWLTKSAAFQEALEVEAETRDTQRHEYLEVLRAWAEVKIRCLMIKSAGNYPSFPYTSDNIDILVRPQDGIAARQVLRSLGYVELRNIEEPHKYLFRKFSGGRCVSAIHVHEEVAWLVGFMAEDALWARMRPAPDDPHLNVPSPEDSVLINLAHACYENKLIRFNEVARVRHALRRTGPDFDWDYVVGVARLRGWLDGLSLMVSVFGALEAELFGSTSVPEGWQRFFGEIVAADPILKGGLTRIKAQILESSLPLPLSYPLCKYLYYRKVFRDPARTIPQRLRDGFLTLVWGLKLKSGLRPQPGLVVSFSGIDGSGKTAHARALVEVFRLCELRADYFWARGGSTGLLRLARPLKGLLLKGKPPTDPTDAIGRRRQNLASPLLRWGWVGLVVLDQLFTAWGRIWLPAFLGRIVVADRYVYDTAIEVEQSLPADDQIGRFLVGLMLRLAPKPHRAFLLDVEAGLARGRKPDEPWHRDLEAERQLYRDAAARHGLALVPTGGPFGGSVDPMIREVFMAYMGRFETVRNALLFSNPSQKNPPDPFWTGGGES